MDDNKKKEEMSAEELIKQLNAVLGIDGDGAADEEDIIGVEEDSVGVEEDSVGVEEAVPSLPQMEFAEDIFASQPEPDVTETDTADSIPTVSEELFYTDASGAAQTTDVEGGVFEDSLIGLSDTLDEDALADIIGTDTKDIKLQQTVSNPSARRPHRVSEEDEDADNSKMFFDDAQYDYMDEEPTIGNLPIINQDEQAPPDNKDDTKECEPTQKDEQPAQDDDGRLRISDDFDAVYNGDGISESGYSDTENDIMSAINLGSLENLYDEDADDTGEVPKAVRKKKKERIPKVPQIAEEFTNPVQRKLFLEQYKKSFRSLRTSVIGAALFTVILAVYESLASFGVNLPHFLDPVENTRVYILVAMQLFVLAAAFMYKGIFSSVKALFRREFKPEMMTVFFILVTLAYGIYLYIVDPTDAPSLFFSPCAFCVLCSVVYEYRDLKREILAFRIVSSSKKKYVLEKYIPTEKSRESNEFYERLSSDDPLMLKINRTSFVEDFMKQSRRTSRIKSKMTILAPASAVLFLGLFITLLLLDNTVYASFGFSFAALTAIVPSAVFTAYSYPLYRAAKMSYEDEGAFIGEETMDSYSSVSVVSFDDSEVFPSYGIKLQSVRMYGESRIDHVLFSATSVFKKLGGPLYDVFENASLEIEKTDNVRIHGVYDDGIEASVNDEHILLGSAAFMELRNYIPMYTTDDEVAESNNEKRIMYMTSNGVIVAKLYLRYTVDSEFVYTLQQLTDAGICIAIKTFDPNIDTELLAGEVNIKKYPVRVVKCSDRSEMSEVKQSCPAAVVSKGSTRSLLQTLGVCDKLAGVTRTNLLIAALSLFIGFVLSLFVLLADIAPMVNSLYICLYQLFWVIISRVLTGMFLK